MQMFGSALSPTKRVFGMVKHVFNLFIRCLAPCCTCDLPLKIDSNTEQLRLAFTLSRKIDSQCSVVIISFTIQRLSSTIWRDGGE